MTLPTHIAEKAKKYPFVLILVSFILGAMGALSMQPWGYWPCLIIALSGLYILIHCSNTKSLAFGVGWFFGFGYFLIGLYWIGNALLVENNDYRWAYPLALCGLPALLSFFPAIGSIFFKNINLTHLTGYLSFVGLFGLIEWLRSVIFTGFPWNLYAYSWAGIPQMSQIVSLIGVYGLSLLTILLFCLPAYFFLNRDHPIIAWACGCTIMSIAIALYGYGHIRLSEPTQYNEQTRIVLVQPNIAQADKWNNDQLFNHFTRHIDLSYEIARDMSLKVDKRPEHVLIVWPETALHPLILERYQSSNIFSDLLRLYKSNAFLITGALRREIYQENMRFFNSLLILNEQGAIPFVYDKYHLVPFGEYMPFSSFIDIAPIVGFSGFEHGDGPNVLTITNDIKIMPLICYEGIFPHITAARSHNKMSLPSPDLFVNVTNDGWYGDSAGPYQHLHQVRFRSIEQGVPLIRSANTGISAVIDPYGRIIQTIDYNAQDVRGLYLPQPLIGYTFYRHWGDIPFFIMAFLMILPMSFKRFKSALNS